MKDYNEMAESVFKRRDTYNAEKRRRMNQFKGGITGAVCCGLAVWLGVGVYRGNQANPIDIPVQEFLENKEEVGNEQTGHPVRDVEDIPADEAGEYHETVSSNELQQGITAFFGGSYINTNGNFVVVLTVDTAENRTAICKELGINESTTVFEVGAYTLEYLTELQSKISSAMRNKELPFVICSALDEINNRIEVGVTTDNEADLKKLLALDTVGGAIAVERAAGAAAKDFAAAE